MERRGGIQDQVELVEEPRRHRDGAVGAAAALLEGLEDHGLAREVDVLACERECLGDPAVGGVEHTATRSSAVK